MVVRTSFSRASSALSSVDDLSALQFASIIGDRRIAELLIDAGSNIDHHSFDGFTALHFAAKHGHVHIIDLLLDHG